EAEHVWVYLGSQAGTVTLGSFPVDPGFSLMVDGGDKIVANAGLAFPGQSLGLSARSVEVGAAANISASSIHLKGLAFATTSVVASTPTAIVEVPVVTAHVSVTGQLTASAGVNILSHAVNQVVMRGNADVDLGSI